MNSFPLSRDAVTLVVGVAAAYSTLSLVTRGLVVLPAASLVDPASALPLPLTLLLGPAAAVGAGVGVVARDVASGAPGFVTAFEAASQFLLGALGHVYWREFGPTEVDGDRARWFGGALPRLALAAVVASCGAAAFLAWGRELLGLAPFAVTALDATVEYVLATLLVGLPLLLGTVRVLGAEERLATATRGGRPGPDPDRGPEPGPGPGARASRRLLLVSLPVAWLAAGTVGAVGYRALETTPPAYLVDRGLGVLLLLYRPGLFGPGAVNVQVVFGSLVVVAFAVLVSLGVDADADGEADADSRRGGADA